MDILRLGLSKLQVIPDKSVKVHKIDNMQLKNSENRHLCKVRYELIRGEKESRK